MTTIVISIQKQILTLLSMTIDHISFFFFFFLFPFLSSCDTRFTQLIILEIPLNHFSYSLCVQFNQSNFFMMKLMKRGKERKSYKIAVPGFFILLHLLLLLSPSSPFYLLITSIFLTHTRKNHKCTGDTGWQLINFAKPCGL